MRLGQDLEQLLKDTYDDYIYAFKMGRDKEAYAYEEQFYAIAEGFGLSENETEKIWEKFDERA